MIDRDARTSPRLPDGGAWIVRIGVAVLFFMFGVDKFDSNPNGEWVRIFAKIGFGQWFRVATGVIEIAGALLLVPPATKRYAGAGLAATMLGACIAHLTVLGDPVACIIPGVFGAAAVIVGFREAEYDVRTFRINPARPRRGAGSSSRR